MLKFSILFIVILLTFLSFQLLNAQSVGINSTGNAPAASAMLDVSSTNSGMLVPRMTLSQRNNISSPATGLLIFQTDNTPGFYYYNGSAWTAVSGGSSSQGLSEYAYIYKTSAQVVEIEADIIFSDNGKKSSNISHAPGTSSITISAAGTYSIWFTVSGVEPNQFTLFQNNVAVEGSTFGSGARTQTNSGMVIVIAAAGDALTLRNHTSAAAVTLQTLAGGTQMNSNAAIMIHKLD